MNESLNRPKQAVNKRKKIIGSGDIQNVKNVLAQKLPLTTLSHMSTISMNFQNIRKRGVKMPDSLSKIHENSCILLIIKKIYCR